MSHLRSEYSIFHLISGVEKLLRNRVHRRQLVKVGSLNISLNLIVFPNFAAFFYLSVSGLSVTAGAHRLWCHRSYKARWPLRLFLMLANCCVAQNDLYDWVR